MNYDVMLSACIVVSELIIAVCLNAGTWIIRVFPTAPNNNKVIGFSEDYK